MRAVVQRVQESSVEVDGRVVGRCGHGFLVLLGVSVDDAEDDAAQMAKKIAQLRVFNDDDGKFNRSIEDVRGGVLLISQFTLFGDARKGNRPSFIAAARPEQAVPLYESVAAHLRARGIPVETGEFGARMMVRLVNDGPVTILLDTKKEF
ncbi:MAG: D-aminoacyl-tRNA deacylase [Candidatus Hydrogenedentota bacterium]